MPRPKSLQSEDVIRLDVNSKHNLQQASARRAVVNYLVENAGSATVQQINERFDMDMTETISALVRIKWVTIEKAGEK